MPFSKLRFLITLILAAFMSAFTITCSEGKKVVDSGPSTTQIALLDSTQQRHIAIYNQLENLLSELDTLTAVDSIQVLISSDSLIDWIVVSTSGLSIQYKNGMRGIIDLAPNRPIEDSGYYNNNQYNGTGFQKAVSPDLVVPISTRTLFLSPCYDDWKSVDDIIRRVGDQKLSQIGYDNFILLINEQCKVSNFCDLSDYAIIILSSHSIYWPGNGVIQEVFLVTGEQINSQTNTDYFDQITSGQIPIYITCSKNRYAISSEFFGLQNRNTFDDFNTFVYLAFCSSDLGAWKNTIIDMSGAAASLGFNNTVSSGKIAEKAIEFFTQMCDVEMDSPLTLSEWYSSIETSWTDDKGRQVGLIRHGEDDFALWSKYIYIVSTSPADGATNVPVSTAISAVFSDDLNPATFTSEKFYLNPIITGKIECSGNVAIFDPVSNLNHNTVYTVTIKAGVENTNGYTLNDDYTWIFTTEERTDNCHNFPPPLGEVWTYRVLGNGYEFSVTTEAVSETVGGYTVYRHRRSDFPPGLGDYVGCDPELGLIWVASDSWNALEPMNPEYYTRHVFDEPIPIRLCPYGTETGTICHSFTEGNYNNRLEIEVLGYEDVTVPYGTFIDAMKVKNTYYDDGDVDDNMKPTYEWIDASIGTVQELEVEPGYEIGIVLINYQPAPIGNPGQLPPAYRCDYCRMLRNSGWNPRNVTSFKH